MTQNTGRVARVAVGAATIVAGVLLVLLAIALRETRSELTAGEPAPDFTIQTFEGDTIRLSELRGQTVVLNFWASWCVECAIEAPTLQSVWQDYEPQNVVVIGIDYTDTEAAARAYLERFGITYPNAPDSGGRISRLYRLTGVPETVVIGPDGRLVALGSAATAPVKLIGPLDDRGVLGEVGLRGLLDRLRGDSTSSSAIRRRRV